MTLSRILLVASALVVSAFTAQAQTQLSTFTAPSDGAFQAGNVIYGLGGAVTFTTGSSAYTLNSVSIRLVTANPVDQTYSPKLLTTSGGVPSGPAVFTDFVLTSSVANVFTFTAQSTYELSPDTTYAFAIRGSNVAEWEQKTLGSYTSTSGWTAGGFSQSGNDITWSALDTRFSGTFSVDATASAIPEPSTYAAMAGACALSLAVWRRSRQGTAKA